ncbi:MAG: glycosyltransferase [Bacteroidia bacterium]|nr:glycosyltransferase [Bacteroidia bacterium]
MSDKSNKLISIIIPAYNYGRYLGECLDSVLEQSYTNWECLVIDNGSQDNTRDVVQTYVNRDARFIYHYTDQKGVSYARNLGIQKSKGLYILPLDADDKIGANYLAIAEKVLSSQPGIKVVYCEAELFGASKGPWKLPDYSWKGLLAENCIFCTALFRRNDALACGGFNENMKEGLEDWEFWIRLLTADAKVYKIPEVLFFYRIKHDSRNAVLDQQLQLKLRTRIFENHRKLYEDAFSIPGLLFENYLLKINNKTLLESSDYKLGKKLIAPLRFFRNIFKSQEK